MKYDFDSYLLYEVTKSSLYTVRIIVELNVPVHGEVLRGAAQKAFRRFPYYSRTVRTDEHGAYVDRLVDIDIMAIGDLVIDTPALQVPHPHLAERDFFLRPMMQLAPNWCHPITGLTAAEMLQALRSS